MEGNGIKVAKSSSVRSPGQIQLQGDTGLEQHAGAGIGAL
jgi:hypothetical protein|tara:strand:- start:536 stop:655 length:120 start_codon:yes stop_codon:yes gene_type:complete